MEENLRKLENKFKEEYSATLKNVIFDLEKIEDAQRSPIFESVHRVSSWTEISNSLRHNIFVFSDMMEYSRDGYSHYRTPVGEFGRGMPQSYNNFSGKGLKGIDISIAYVRRAELIGRQGSKHVAFWRDYLSRLGAEVHFLHH